MGASVQARVKEMYEAHPYPRVVDPFNAGSIESYRRSFHYLGATPERFGEAVVLDAGCGTGEKSLYMAGLGARHVVGLDLSATSIRHARENAVRYGIRNLTFLNGSVLDLPFPDHSFDVVHSSGVLHHTADPYGGFQELVRVLKPGGIVMVCLYNRYADWLYHIEKGLVCFLAGDDLDRRVRISKRLFGFKEKRLAARENIDLETRLYDKYAHPQASAHSIGETLGWFRKNGVEFLGIYPPLSLKATLGVLARKDSKGHYHVPFVLKPAAVISSVMLKFLPPGESQAPYPYPSRIMRLLVQCGLFVAGLYDYSYGVCYSGIEPPQIVQGLARSSETMR
jgi:SAM-dependent methyltransferase